jgi:hypothetical protein
VLCPAGTYSDVEGLDACKSPCTASPGFTCGLGSVDNHGTPCPAGRYSPSGAECLGCPAGLFSYPGAFACRVGLDRASLLALQALYSSTQGASWFNRTGVCFEVGV